MRGCFDAICKECGHRIGWIGRYSDMPPCPGCGHEVDEKAKAEAEDFFTELAERMTREREEEEAREWSERTPTQESDYVTGWLEADAMEDPSSVMPLDVPSPWYATKTPDRKFHDERHHWWMFGWHDRCAGVDRTSAVDLGSAVVVDGSGRRITRVDRAEVVDLEGGGE